jgi:predicted small lipoprotein YifL
MRRRLSLVCMTALLLSATFVMSACGKKGPLYLPDDANAVPARSAPSGK